MPEPRDAQDKKPDAKSVGDSAGKDLYKEIDINRVKGGAISVGGNAYDQRTYIQGSYTQPLPEGRGRFTVPFEDNEQFVGRKRELNHLHKILQEKNKVGIRPAGLTGMGGIGKTQLAVKYAHMRRDDYPGGVFWINAAKQIRPQLVELADRLRLTPADINSPDRMGQMIFALAAYLHGEADTLLIYDNVENPAVFARHNLGASYTPFTLGGRILITTRRTILPKEVTPLNLNILLDNAAHKMLFDVRPDADPGEVQTLCRMLGNLPLALKLAAASLKNKPGMALATYREKLLAEGAEVVHDKAKVTPEDLETYYEISLTPALKAQWGMVDDEYARKLFKLAGQFGEAAVLPLIRLGLLTNMHDDDDGYETPLTDARDELLAVSLIESLEDDHIRLHPLVREFAAGQTADGERAAFLSQCAANLADAFEDMAALESQWRARGIDALQEDLLTTLELISPAPETTSEPLSIPPWRIDRQTGERLSIADQQALKRVQMLLRLLQREVHTLRGDRAGFPRNHLAQQLAYRVWDLNLKPLLDRISNHLSLKGQPTFDPAWAAKIESEALDSTFLGHSAAVNGVAITPDGKRAVSASDDRTLKIWNLESGQEEGTLGGHSSLVRAVAITPDGKRAVSASDDRTLKIWNLESGQEEGTLEGHSSLVRAVAITPDGKRAVSASDDRTLKIWNLESGQEEGTLGGHSSLVRAVAITPDGKRAVSASDDRTLKIWNLESGQEEGTLEGHSSLVRAVAITPDGKRAVSASDDRTLKIWNLESGQEEGTLEGHSSLVRAVAITPDGKRAVSASSDRTLKIWNLESGQEEGTLEGHSSLVRAVAITPDGKRAVSASSDRTLKIWNLESGQEEGTLEGHSSLVRAVAITPDGKRAVLASDDRTLKIWNLESGQEEGTLEGHSSLVRAVAITPDGKRAVSASDDRTLKIWNLESGQEEGTLEGHSSLVLSVAITPDGKRAVSASDDRTLKIWNLESGQEEGTLEGHSSLVLSVAITPDGKRAVSASSDRTLKIWNLESGQEEGTLEGHSSLVLSVAITPDGKRAVSASSDRTLKIWNLESGQEEGTLEGHSSLVRAVAITPDGKRAVSASSDRTLKIWNLETGKQIASITLDGPLLCVALSPDDHTIITGDQGGNVYCLRYVEPGPPNDER